ncbi:K(+)-transporting ATPase subunit F [Niastella sp. MAH-29]|nr:K(+)-transporting ATPase subunit F [Niastella soli]
MKKYKSMINALFILSILVFGYLLYVLIKPEKF